MKRLTAILLLTLIAVFMLCGCRKEAEMIETGISSIMSEATDNTKNHENNGTVTDGDGHIGNEDEENRTDKTDATDTSTASSREHTDNVL